MVDIEEQVQTLQGDVDSQRPILEPDRLTKLVSTVRLKRQYRSTNLVPQFQGTMSPFDVLVMSTTGLRMPGTAALAMMADQTTQFGAVRYCRKEGGGSAGNEHDGTRRGLR